MDAETPPLLDLSLSSARRLVKAAIGPRARVWESSSPSPCYLVGLDQWPGRRVLGFGLTPGQAVQRAFDPHNQRFGEPTAEELESLKNPPVDEPQPENP